MSRIASTIDHVLMRASLLGKSRSQADRLDISARLAALKELRDQYDRAEWLDDPDGFFGHPAAPEHTRRDKSRWGRTSISLRWPSSYQTLMPDLQEQYDRFEHNKTVHVRWYRSATPRPTAIVIHGYGGGQFLVESRVFPVKRWLDSGLDVALFSLPFHGPRRAPGDKIRFPSSLPSVTIEGFRQAIGDLRALTSLLLDEGVPDVGVIGMSLGGYTAALLATADDRLSFGMSYIPLASVADYAADRGRLRGTDSEKAAQREGLERVYAVTSPLGRPPRLDPHRYLVAGGEGDRITPMRHAERIATHFGSDLVRFSGGHLFQHGRSVAWKALDRRLRELDIL